MTGCFGKAVPGLIGAWHQFGRAKEFFFASSKEEQEKACTASGFLLFWSAVVRNKQFAMCLRLYAAIIVLASKHASARPGVTREKSARFLLYKPVMTAGMTMPCRNFAWLPMRLLQIHPVARLEPRPVVTSSPSQVPAQTAPAQAVQTQMVPNCKPFWQNVSRNNCTLWTVFMGYIQHCAL